MQINIKAFEKFITIDLVSEICSYCSISLFLTFIARFFLFFFFFLFLYFFSFFIIFFFVFFFARLQDCEACIKHFVAMDIYFFI